MPNIRFCGLVGLMLFGLLSLSTTARAQDVITPEVITVDTGSVLRNIGVNPIGIDFDYLRDSPALRPAGSAKLEDVMKEMGIRWIRYPGGEKSDWHFFAPPPFTKPDPQAFGWYKTQLKIPLNFDQYMTMVRQIGATPYLVTGYDSFNRTGITKEEYLAHAVGWVKYSNVTKKYGVKYWEIGNENWHNNTATADEMAVIVTEFSKAMKAVDPTIKIGTSVNGPGWAQTLLDKAGDHIDFLSYSNYFSSHQGYRPYRDQPKIDLIHNGQQIADVVARSPYKGRVQVIAAEFGATDFAQVPQKEKWQGNDLGHAIVLFDMAGQFLCDPRITAAMFWTTRWMNDMAADTSFYALGPKNDITTVGRALAIWGQFQKKQMVLVRGPVGLPAFASFDRATGGLSIFIINKAEAAREVKVVIPGAPTIARMDTYRFAGTGPEDTSPVWAKIVTGQPSDEGVDEVSLAGTSITIIDLALGTPF